MSTGRVFLRLISSTLLFSTSMALAVDLWINSSLKGPQDTYFFMKKFHFIKLFYVVLHSERTPMINTYVYLESWGNF